MVSSATQTSDQNIDNLRVVSNVLSQSAQVIKAMNVSIEAISSVRFNLQSMVFYAKTEIMLYF